MSRDNFAPSLQNQNEKLRQENREMRAHILHLNGQMQLLFQQLGTVLPFPYVQALFQGTILQNQDTGAAAAQSRARETVEELLNAENAEKAALREQVQTLTAQLRYREAQISHFLPNVPVQRPAQDTEFNRNKVVLTSARGFAYTNASYSNLFTLPLALRWILNPDSGRWVDANPEQNPMCQRYIQKVDSRQEWRAQNADPHFRQRIGLPPREAGSDHCNAAVVVAAAAAAAAAAPVLPVRAEEPDSHFDAPAPVGLEDWSEVQADEAAPIALPPVQEPKRMAVNHYEVSRATLNQFVLNIKQRQSQEDGPAASASAADPARRAEQALVSDGAAAAACAPQTEASTPQMAVSDLQAVVVKEKRKKKPKKKSTAPKADLPPPEDATAAELVVSDLPPPRDEAAAESIVETADIIEAFCCFETERRKELDREAVQTGQELLRNEEAARARRQKQEAKIKEEAKARRQKKEARIIEESNRKEMQAVFVRTQLDDTQQKLTALAETRRQAEEEAKRQAEIRQKQAEEDAAIEKQGKLILGDKKGVLVVDRAKLLCQSRPVCSEYSSPEARSNPAHEIFKATQEKSFNSFMGLCKQRGVGFKDVFLYATERELAVPNSDFHFLIELFDSLSSTDSTQSVRQKGAAVAMQCFYLDHTLLPYGGTHASLSFPQTSSKTTGLLFPHHSKRLYFEQSRVFRENSSHATGSSFLLAHCDDDLIDLVRKLSRLLAVVYRYVEFQRTILGILPEQNSMRQHAYFLTLLDTLGHLALCHVDHGKVSAADFRNGILFDNTFKKLNDVPLGQMLSTLEEIERRKTLQKVFLTLPRALKEALEQVQNDPVWIGMRLAFPRPTIDPVFVALATKAFSWIDFASSAVDAECKTFVQTQERKAKGLLVLADTIKAEFTLCKKNQSDLNSLLFEYFTILMETLHKPETSLHEKCGYIAIIQGFYELHGGPIDIAKTAWFKLGWTGQVDGKEKQYPSAGEVFKSNKNSLDIFGHCDAAVSSLAKTLCECLPAAFCFFAKAKKQMDSDRYQDMQKLVLPLLFPFVNLIAEIALALPPKKRLLSLSDCSNPALQKIADPLNAMIKAALPALILQEAHPLQELFSHVLKDAVFRAMLTTVQPQPAVRVFSSGGATPAAARPSDPRGRRETFDEHQNARKEKLLELSKEIQAVAEYQFCRERGVFDVFQFNHLAVILESMKNASLSKQYGMMSLCQYFYESVPNPFFSYQGVAINPAWAGLGSAVKKAYAAQCKKFADQKDSLDLFSHCDRQVQGFVKTLCECLIAVSLFVTQAQINYGLTESHSVQEKELMDKRIKVSQPLMDLSMACLAKIALTMPQVEGGLIGAAECAHSDFLIEANNLNNAIGQAEAAKIFPTSTVDGKNYLLAMVLTHPVFTAMLWGATQRQQAPAVACAAAVGMSP